MEIRPDTDIIYSNSSESLSSDWGIKLYTWVNIIQATLLGCIYLAAFIRSLQGERHHFIIFLIILMLVSNIMAGVAAETGNLVSKQVDKQQTGQFDASLFKRILDV